MNYLVSIQMMKGKYSWFPIETILLNQVNIFIHTHYLITILDIMSVSVSAYTSTGLITPSSYINIGQLFKTHPNTHT
jgi:hypothetical protein